ncbi:MAG: cupin domain-containing protein, partial [Kiloniellales bacterium]|nr:cupin domain-containing protein [Kiloniellales bacterium]
AGLPFVLALALGATIFFFPIKSLSDIVGPTFETILETRTTNLGQPIHYPGDGAAEITAVIVTLEPGQETGRHRHSVPLYGHVLSGQLTVDYGEFGSKTYVAGEAFMEAMDTWHTGRNSGEETLRILAVFLGAEGRPNSEKP